MPRRRRTYKKKPRRRYRRRVYKRKPIPMTGLGRRLLGKMRYCTEVTVNPATASKVAHVFRANDLYDPDVTGIGHQPMGFDQIMQYYDHFKVIGSKITVHPIDSDTTTHTPAYWGIVLSDNATTVASTSSVEHLLESRNNNRQLGVHSGNLISPLFRRSMSKSFSHKKFFKQALTDKFQGNVFGSPAEQAYYEVWCASIQGNDPPSQSFVVYIDYIALFTEPKNLGQS